MHSHLDIEVNGKSLVIPEDSSLSVEEKNPLFNDVTFFSYPMQIPVEGNREVLKNIAHRDSNMRAMDLEHADARIFADGLPLNHGQVITQDGSEIKDTFEFNIDAQQQSFDELIGDLGCQDVKVKDRLVIGEKIGKIDYTYNYLVKDLYLDDEYPERGLQVAPIPISRPFGPDFGGHTREYREDNGTGIMDAPQALGFSFPGKCIGFPSAEKSVDVNTDVAERNAIGFYKPKVSESYINVWKPYPFPYCNSRMAYAHPGRKTNDDGTLETEGYVVGNDKGSQLEDYGQYWCLDADRQQSGICFYVLYFLDCLFEQLKVTFDKSELLGIEDFTRLCFVTTKCSYDSIQTDQKLNSIKDINDWLRSRNCGGQISFSLEVGTPKSYGGTVDQEHFSGNNLPKSYETDADGNINAFDEYSRYPKYLHTLDYGMYYYRQLSAHFSCSSYIDEMVANSGNFPDASVSDIIKSLENSFGVRFLYDPEKRLVTARLLRNVFIKRKIRQFNGKVLSMTPVNEKITGVRVAYSAESDSKEQRKNVREGVRDYDTDFDYIEFPEERTIYDRSYVQIARAENVSANNMNVYIDLQTGNSYRIKINSEAENTMTLKPVLFQVAQNKGVEEGDCSERNKDYVREMISSFKPVPTNVINAAEYNGDAAGNVAPIMAPFLDVDMEREYLKKTLLSIGFYNELKNMKPVISSSWTANPNASGAAFPNGIQLECVMRMWLNENYDPTQTDNGNSPLQDIDWGLTIGVMRGPGAGYGYVADEIADGESVEYADSEAISSQNFSTYLRTYLYRLMPDVYPHCTLQDVISKLSSPEYADAEMVDTEHLGSMTIGRLKQLINQLFSYQHDTQVEMTDHDCLVNAYYAYTGQLSKIHQVVINGRKAVTDSMEWVLEKRFEGMNMSSKAFQDTLSSNVANGTWPANVVIYERCQLTYGQLNEYYEHFSFIPSGRLNVVTSWYAQLEALIGYTYPGSDSSTSTSVTGSQIVHFDKNYDGFGNDKWRQTVGAYVLTSDSMDLKGASFDYDSNEVGGVGERFSLQIRAYQQPSWATEPLCDDDERDAQGNIIVRVRSRGLYDVFLHPYAYFLLHRKPFKVKVLATVAQLLDIRNHWEDKYVLDGKVGWINAIKYNIEKATGISEAELEFYSL